MVNYANDTKINDIPDPSFEVEVKELLKTVILDFDVTMTKEVFEHTYKRLALLIKAKYKGFILGEVKYVFEAMTEHMKGKPSVTTILQMFWKYYENKIEKQRQQAEIRDVENIEKFHNAMSGPLCMAIVHKINLHNKTLLKLTDWETMPIKALAQQIIEGTLRVDMSINKKQRHAWY